MSEDLFYNRDRNISGISVPDNLSDLSLYPVYGSRAEFTSKILSYETDDSYFNAIPASLNNLSVAYKVRYDVNEENCAKLVNFFESKEGYQSFDFNPDNSGIYKSNKAFCDNYAINYINNNHYELAVDITVDQVPSFFNWKSSYILNFNTGQGQDIWNNINNPLTLDMLTSDNTSYFINDENDFYKAQRSFNSFVKTFVLESVISDTLNDKNQTDFVIFVFNRHIHLARTWCVFNRVLNEVMN